MHSDLYARIAINVIRTIANNIIKIAVVVKV
jgi:hypothetical protein